MILNEILFSSSSSLSNTLVRRFVFYGSKLIGEDVHVGDKYDDMKKDESILIGKYDPRTLQGNSEDAKEKVSPRGFWMDERIWW